MRKNYPQNICFEVLQAGTILGVRIYLLPICDDLRVTREGLQNPNQTLQVLLKELKRAQIPANSFSNSLRLLGEKEMRDDYKTLVALGAVLNTFTNVNLGEITWDRDTGQGITIIDKIA